MKHLSRQFSQLVITEPAGLLEILASTGTITHG